MSFFLGFKGNGLNGIQRFPATVSGYKIQQPLTISRSVKINIRSIPSLGKSLEKFRSHEIFSLRFKNMVRNIIA